VTVTSGAATLPRGEFSMPDDDETDGHQRRTMIAAGAVVLLLVVGLLLARELFVSAKLQDCLMSGRTNCAPVLPAQ
jgi:hypothetical protein